MNELKYLAGMILLILRVPVFAQENLDVLPLDGREELFHSYLMGELYAQSTRRKSDVVEALTSAGKLRERQSELRRNYRMLLGDLPEKTPLNDSVAGTIEMEGYNIDRVLYESLPDHHVTANFYYPAGGRGPYPGILFPCGHYPEAKAQKDRLQNLCILLATHGFAVLIVDPVCQGERYQIRDPESPDRLYFVGESGTKQHTRLDVGAMLTGTSVVAYELWDNYRGIDYLVSRPEVDTSRIGCTGSSGGGAQATYLSAFDPRIKVAAVNSYITSETVLFSTIGPQTGSQNLSYEGLYGIDHPDYISMFAPKPFMILAGSKDFFDTLGTHQTCAEARLVYERLGVPDRIGYFEYNDGHGYSRPKREAATRWFRTWFYGDTAAVTEPPGHPTLPENALNVTRTGQVMYEFDTEKNLTDLNVERARSEAPERSGFWKNQTRDSCLNMVRHLIRLEKDRKPPAAEITGTVQRDQYTIRKIRLTSGNLTPVPGLLFVPDDIPGKMPAVLYVDGHGKNSDAGAGGIIGKICTERGAIVFAVDVRGFGETADDPGKNEAKHGNVEHRNAVISGYIGRTLIGQRVADIMDAADYLLRRDDVDPDRLSIVGTGRAGTAVLHAGALDGRFREVVIRQWTDTTWLTVVEAPTVLNNLTHVVPGALQYYDLPDLARAISPRIFRYEGAPGRSAALRYGDPVLYPAPEAGKTLPPKAVRQQCGIDENHAQ